MLQVPTSVSISPSRKVTPIDFYILSCPRPPACHQRYTPGPEDFHSYSQPPLLSPHTCLPSQSPSSPPVLLRSLSPSTSNDCLVFPSEWDSCILPRDPLIIQLLWGLWIVVWLSCTLWLMSTYSWVHTIYVFQALCYPTQDDIVKFH